MAILVRCECGRQLEAKEEFAGRRTKCPDCGRELVIPDPGAGGPGAGDPGAGGPVAGDPGAANPYSTPAADPDFGGPSKLEPPSASGKAIASLVLGLSSFVCCVVTGIPAIILGVLGLGDINRSGGRVTGHGLAVGGIVTGALSSILVVPAVLIALLLPAVQAAREAARRAQCTNNLKQIGLALHNFHDAQGKLPPAAIVGQDGKPLLSWRVAILPFIEQGNLYNQFKLDEPWDSPHNKALLSMMPSTYACPSEPSAMPPGSGLTTYRVLVGPGTLFEEGQTVNFRTVTDGMSQTLAVVESSQAVPWTQPDELAYEPAGPLPAVGSRHPGGFNALLADGSVHLVKKTTPEQVLRALITRNGGEVVGDY